MEVKVFDNITEIVCDDMETTISKGSKVSVAAACFSMYAYKELKKQLESVEEFRFIFTSPTFVTEKAEKQKREFYIPLLIYSFLKRYGKIRKNCRMSQTLLLKILLRHIMKILRNLFIL